MTIVGEKDSAWIDDVTTVINCLNRCGVGTNPDTKDYDDVMRIRSKWASVSNEVGNASISFEPMAYELGLQSLFRGLITYGKQTLTAASASATTLLGNSGLGVDEIDDLTSMLAAGSISANPTNYASATKLAAIIKTWADLWPLTLTNPSREPIENVLPVFKDIKDHYNEVVMDLYPERVVNGDGNAMGQMAEFAQADDVLFPYSTSVIYSLGGTFFSAAIADGIVYLDMLSEQRVWLRNPANATSYTLFNIAKYGGGYSIDFKLTCISGSGVGTTSVNGTAIANSAAIGVGANITGLTMRVYWTAFAGAPVEDVPVQISTSGSVGTIVEKRIYVCTVDIPDNIAGATAPIIRLDNNSGGVATGLWKIEIASVRATGAGGAARSLWSKSGYPYSSTTRLITVLGDTLGNYASAIFQSPWTRKYMSMLVWYDSYRSQQGRPTMAVSAQQAFLRLQQQNGDTLADETILTTEKVTNLAFWLQGMTGITSTTLQSLYRYMVMVMLLTVRLMCGDVGFIQYVTNQSVVGSYVY